MQLEPRSCLIVVACLACGGCVSETLADDGEPIAAATSMLSPPIGETPTDPGWRDLGGYQIVLTSWNAGEFPATGWRRAECSTSYETHNTTYFPGLARPGTFLLFKSPDVSQANFEKYWELTAAAPPPLSSTKVVDRVLFFDQMRSAVLAVDDQLVNGSFISGSTCYQRTSPTQRLAGGFLFNATPGTGTAEVGDGKPYITELCKDRNFMFVEVFVP